MTRLNILKRLKIKPKRFKIKPVWTFLITRFWAFPSHQRHNATAVLISFVAVSILYLNFEPTPAEADPSAANAALASLQEPVIAPRPSTLASGSNSNSTGNDKRQTSGRAADVIEGQRALLMSLLLLEKGVHEISKVPDYTATFCKHERIDGTLGDNQVMQLKLRHKPFSVYMKWLVGDKDRELLYVDGQNDGKMLVKLGGIKGKFLPALKLTPTGSIAMREARYPVTKLGLRQMAQEMIGHRRNEISGKVGVRCQMLADQKIQKRDCYCFIFVYDSAKTSEIYRKSIVYIDKEYSLPVLVKNYGWPTDVEEETKPAKLDEATLVEHYLYTNIRLKQQLANAEFDRGNKNYNFRR